ncbi:MAG: hypothetical protein JWM93_30, partial [Frankiales bacterium]|nr:hypothetical protein [Frankiales bacterium]
MTDPDSSIVVVIPALNEAERIA